MNRKDVKIMTHKIISEFNELIAMRRMLIALPLNHILRGFYIEDSGLDKESFYVWTLVQPLYVPSNTIMFNLSKRLGKGTGTRWNLNLPATQENLISYIRKDGIPYIKHVTTPDALVMFCDNFLDKNDPYVRQARAYSLVAANRTLEALGELNELSTSLDNKIPWMSEMKKRAEMLNYAIQAKSSDVSKLLLNWEKETISKLGIKVKKEKRGQRGQVCSWLLL
jgi:hypothetical protein